MANLIWSERNGSGNNDGQSLTSTLAAKANETTQYVGEQVEKLGKSIHQQAPQEGVLRTVTEVVAESLENTGAYLQDASVQDAATAMTNLVRQHPLSSLTLSIGIGYWLARNTARRKL